MSPLSDFGKADLEERDCYEEKKNIQHLGEMPCGDHHGRGSSGSGDQRKLDCAWPEARHGCRGDYESGIL